jgi:hypothetical protein
MNQEKSVSVFKKYFSEFALIFISVLLAFGLTEWSTTQGEKLSESKILSEIKNGIETDSEDFESNLKMHKISMSAVRAFRNWANNLPLTQDSLRLQYFLLYRNYSPIINKTGYESLKETSLKVITNDSLRFQIIKLYEYYYNILDQLDNKNEEMQDFKVYFSSINKILTPYMIFDVKGNLTGFKKATLAGMEKKELLSYLWRMELTKSFKIKRYDEVINEIAKLNHSITNELKNRK